MTSESGPLRLQIILVFSQNFFTKLVPRSIQSTSCNVLISDILNVVFLRGQNACFENLAQEIAPKNTESGP